MLSPTSSSSATGMSLKTGITTEGRPVIAAQVTDSNLTFLSDAHRGQITRMHLAMRQGILPEPLATLGKTADRIDAVIINSNAVSIPFQQMFHSYHEQLQHAAVQLIHTPHTGTSNFIIFSNGTPEAEDAITYQANLLAEEFANAKKSVPLSITVRPYREAVKELKLDHIDKMKQKVLQIVSDTVAKKKPVLGIIERDSDGKSRMLQRISQSTSSSNALLLLEDDLKKLASSKSTCLPQSIVKTLKAINPTFQQLNVIQLLELILLRNIETNPSNTPPVSSSSSSSSISLPKQSISIENAVKPFGLALPLLKEGVMTRELTSALASVEQLGGLDKTLKLFIGQMRSYLTKELDSVPGQKSYRVHPQLLSFLQAPIDGRTVTTSSSEAMISIPKLIDVMLTSPLVVVPKQEESLQTTIKPALMALIETCAKELGWSEQKAEIARQCLETLHQESLERHRRTPEFLQLWNDLIKPIVDLVPFSKMVRLQKEGKENQIGQWVDRNKEDLQNLSEYVVMLSQSLDSSYCDNFFYLRQQVRKLLGYLCSDQAPISSTSTFENIYHQFSKLSENEEIYSNWYRALDTTEANKVEIARALTEHLDAYIQLDTDSTTSLALCCSSANLINTLTKAVLSARKSYHDRIAATASLLSEQPRRPKAPRGRSSKPSASSSRGKPKARGGTSSSSTVSPSAPPVIPQEVSLKPLLSGDRIAAIHDALLEAIDTYKHKFSNTFAQQCWNNALELYRDLFSELLDRPTLRNSSHVNDYVNRIVVLLSQLMEQVVSAHALEQKKPTNLLQRHRVVSHDILRMLSKSGLEARISELRPAMEAINGLEMLARNLKTQEYRPSQGAQLLYDADQLAFEPSDSYAGHELVTRIQQLVTDQLSLLCRILDMDTPIDFRPLQEIPSYDETPRYKIDGFVAKIAALKEKINNLTSPSTNSSMPANSSTGYLSDALRLLELIQARLERHSENGNVRNFFKTIATSMALALENTAITLAGRMGQRDLSRMRWSEFTHDLTNLFEDLGIHDLSEKEESFLEASDRIHNLTRYSANYKQIQGRDSAQDLYLQLVKRLNPADATSQGGVGASSWQSADKRLKNTVKEAISDIYERLDTGLDLLDKLLERFPRFNNPFTIMPMS